MNNALQNLRPVLTQPEYDFGKLLAHVLSPSRPLQSEEFLRGREEQLTGIRKALYAAGRHVFIHEFRGVGKSSLAQTAAFTLSSAQQDPVLLGCDKSNSFGSIMRDLFEEVVSRNPAIEKTLREGAGGFNLGLLTGNGKVTHQEGRASEPNTINEAVRMVRYLCEKYSKDLVVVVDEFDQIKDKEEQEHFANFIKQLSDKHVTARFIFCGIGETIDALMSAHGSADRYFHTVSLDRLDWDARLEIITGAADALGIIIDDTTKYRIAKISDGFPHYVHLITEKLFWRVFEARNNGTVSGALFELSMTDASDAMEMKLKQPYEAATRKYTNDYETILFAVADGHELQRRSTDIFESYVRIMKSLGREPLEREKFNARMNSLKKPSYGAILSANRTGWYEFTEKVIRGYARLRAEQNHVQLEVDHPIGTRRLGWKGAEKARL
ncbi:AAA family ATPase [Shinella zoogloeoides]